VQGSWSELDLFSRIRFFFSSTFSFAAFWEISWFGDWGFASGVWGLGFRAQGLEIKIWGAGFRCRAPPDTGHAIAQVWYRGGGVSSTRPGGSNTRPGVEHSPECV